MDARRLFRSGSDEEMSGSEHSDSDTDDENEVTKAIAQTLHEEKEKTDEFDGNCYKYFAFRHFGEKKIGAATGTLFSVPDSRFEGLVTLVGIGLIMVIQVIGPLTIFASNLSHLVKAFRPGAIFTMGISQKLVILLATSFLFCFILFAYKGTGSDIVATEKAMRLAKGLQHFGKPVQPIWLLIDVIINSWVALSLSICMFSILFKEEDGISVVFDSLSVAFLLNLDDIASDLGFLGDIWDPEKIGTFYKECQDRGVFSAAGVSGSHKDDPEERALVDEVDEDSEGNVLTRGITAGSRLGLNAVADVGDMAMFKIPRRIQKCTQMALLGLLFLSLSAPFLFESNAKVDKSLRDMLTGQINLGIPGMGNQSHPPEDPAQLRRLLELYIQDLEY